MFIQQRRKGNNNGAVFSTKVVETTQMDTYLRNNKLHSELTPFTKGNSRWMTHLNIKCKAIRVLEDTPGENLGDLGHGDDFFIYSTKGMTQERNDKLDLIKTKNFFVKDSIMRIRRQHTARMKIFAKDTYDK